MNGFDRSIVYKPPTIGETKPTEFDFTGKIVHIVASGPSLTGKGLAFFESLRTKKTIFIAVNHAYKVCNPDFIFFIDKEFATLEDDKKVLEHPATKFCFDSQIAGCRFLFPLREKHHSSDLSRYYRGSSSGCAALSFAAKRNPLKIFLWGFDAGKIPGHKNIHATSGVFKHRFDSIKDSGNFSNGIKDFFEIKNDNIFNVSPNSNIPYFQKISFDEFEAKHNK